jgi:hypothetical protein
VREDLAVESDAHVARPVSPLPGSRWIRQYRLGTLEVGESVDSSHVIRAYREAGFNDWSLVSVVADNVTVDTRIMADRVDRCEPRVDLDSLIYVSGPGTAVAVPPTSKFISIVIDDTNRRSNVPSSIRIGSLASLVETIDALDR